jgi:1-acyl-sn-glycerol-3-phosphate acyltransferase|nr:lysophospholipid acyltransferase family protein [Chryseobacterium sp. KMC2]
MGIPVYILSFNKKHYKYAYKFIRIWCFGMFYGMGFRYDLIKLSEQKKDKNQQYVFISNHTSIMDIMLTCILFPDHPVCFVGKKELVKIPIFGTIYKRICVMVDRTSAKSRADVYRRCAEKMEEGNSIAIFPEGGVPDDTSIILDEFKDGAFMLSSKYHSPIAVYTFIGLKEMFPFDSSQGYPGRVKVYFNGIIQPTNSPKDSKSEAYQEIKKTLLEYSI